MSQAVRCHTIRSGSPFVCRALRAIPLVAVLAAVALSMMAHPVAAEGELRGPPTDPQHRSVLKVADFSAPSHNRKLTIGVDKALLVEMPFELTDVLVSNPEVVDASLQSSRRVFLIAKDLGEANAILIGQDGRKLILDISVARDLRALTDMIRRLIPGSQVTAEMAGDNVVLAGHALTPVDVNRAGDLASRFAKTKDKVVNLIKTAAKDQVHLRVKVSEMSREALRRLGVDLPGALLSAGQFSFAKIIRNSLSASSQVVSESAARAAGGVPFAVSGVATATTWTRGNQSITALLQLLERTGLVKTLAEPNLTALSGEEAKFLAGGEIPIPVSAEDNKVFIEYKEFGVSVKFKPVVLDAGTISLRVEAEVSELSGEGSVQIGGLSIPGLKVRRAQTTLELPSGGTLAMAGLISEDTRQAVEGVPGLKDLPTLGALFRSNDFRKNETELVILVTPYLAKHAAKSEMSTPDDGFTPENNLTRVFLGRLNRVHGGQGDDLQTKYRGDVGFIIEYPELPDPKG